MHGYEGRGVGIKMKDNVNSAAGSDDREWFVGTGYNQSGFNIGYASDGSQSSYAAQAKLSITTSGNAVFEGNIGVGGNAASNGYMIDITPSGGNIIRSTRGTSVFGSYQSNNSDVYLGTISSNTFKIITNDTTAITVSNSQNATFAGDVTVSGGDITLGGTGRIQGVDTVTDATDAANKDYVDTAVGAVPVGTVTGVSSSTTSQLQVSESSPAPALSIITAAVTNGGTALATGNQIYDATTTRLASYLPLAGGTMTGNIDFGDNVRARFGDGDDLQIVFDGSNSYIHNVDNGDLYLRQQATDRDIILECDDGSGGLTTYFQLDGGNGLNRFYKNVLFQDNVSASFGSSFDLQIFHDGTNSVISDQGTGLLAIRGSEVKIKSPSTSEVFARFIENSSVELYYNNSKKFETASTGVTITAEAVVGNGTNGLQFSHSTGNSSGIINTGFSSTAVEIRTGNVQRMSINSTGATFAGDIVLGASSSIVLDDTPTASTASGSGTIVNWSVSESVTAGTLYAVKTNGGWTLADADNENTAAYMLAIALGSNATAGMLLQGFFYKSSHGFIIGAPLYVSNTSGTFSNSRPTGTGDYVRIIGYATSTNYIYFDPDKTWVKID